MLAAISASDYDMKGNADRAKQITKKLKNDDLSQEKRQTLKQELTKIRSSFGQMLRTTLSNPDIKQQRMKLKKQTLQAMREQNDQTDKLMNRLKELRNKLLAMAHHKGQN